MSDVTRILSAIEQGDPHAAAQLMKRSAVWPWWTRQRPSW
jgi:DNA-binding GntR family transcriptional regulator